MKKFSILLCFIIMLFISLMSGCGVEPKISAQNSADEILDFMLGQNLKYVSAKSGGGDASAAIRNETVTGGQQPYATVITCSESRVFPEHIFLAGIGEIFVVRTVGNIVSDYEISSIEYAAEHLRTPLIIVMGHTRCGAVSAAISGESHDYGQSITDEIGRAIAGETDASVAEQLNVKNSVSNLAKSKILTSLNHQGKIKVVGAVNDISTGAVTLIDAPLKYTSKYTAQQLYSRAVDDSMVTEHGEIEKLINLTARDENVTMNDSGKVLVGRWHRHYSSNCYCSNVGGSMVMGSGYSFVFSLKEMQNWYKRQGDITDFTLRLEQLIGLPPNNGYKEFTFFYVDIEDLLRPSYCSNVTVNHMSLQLCDHSSNDTEFTEWFSSNILSSYYSSHDYPWTRLGYTYDWSDNGCEYGLSEFLIKPKTTVDVELTFTNEQFFTYLQS